MATRTCSTTMLTRFVFLLLVSLERSLEAAAQSVSVANVTHNSATISWDIVVEGASIQTFQISVECRTCVPFDVSGNTTSYALTGLKDNTPFEVCVTPYTASGMGMASQDCVRFRTRLSPHTVGALSSGLFLVVSFFVLLAMDLLCRRHQIEVEDAKRDELLQQGWQTFKRSSTGRVAKKVSRSSAPPMAQAQENEFDNVADVTLEEELPE